MKRLSLIALLITIISMNISALKLETTKEFALQGGYGEVLSISVSTMTSQAESDLIGMPFDILDPYVQYNSSVDNPSYGERVIGTWAILANCNFSLSINATPLRHVTNSNAQPLYYRLAHEFSLAYTNTSGAATEVKGYYVFVPNENATDGSGTTRAYIGNSYKTDSNIFVISSFRSCSQFTGSTIALYFSLKLAANCLTSSL